jgi:hypothetical protein
MYIPRILADIMWASTKDSTCVSFGLGHRCMKHNTVFNLDHLASCSEIQGCQNIARFAKKIKDQHILEWDEVPEYAHQYFMIKAGRQLQEAILGSADLSKINAAAEAEARSLFLEEETSRGDHSWLRGNPNHTDVFMTFKPARTLRR